MKKFYLIASLCVAMCACNDNSFVNEPIQENDVVMSRAGESSSVGEYTVTPEMVCKYLNVARKGKNINSLNPIVENGDTLAYVAQYDESQGWDLISGDRRLDPVLVFATSGILDINDTEKPAVNAMLGMLDMVRDVKMSNNIQKNGVWASLEPKQFTGIMPREMGIGMWIALDTISESTTEVSNRLITTKWGQGNPWYVYTPYQNGQHCKVGCVAVAVAQYLYFYRKNNHSGYSLPSVVTFTNTSNSTPVFSNFSESGWSGMALKTTDAGTDKSAMFMSYLGMQLNLIYGPTSTSGHMDDMQNVLNFYDIGRTESYNYDGESVIYSLENGNPVFIAARSTTNTGHMFLIDGYSKQKDRTYATFVWDAGYKYTQEDIMKNESWRFFESVSFMDEKGEYAEKELYINSNTHIAMNWGWNGVGDETYYLASKRSEPNSEETYLAPYWKAASQSIYNDIHYIAYNGYAY